MSHSPPSPPSSSSSSPPHTSSSSKQRKRAITVHVIPTLGDPFALTCPQNSHVDRLKEDVSDRVGISPKKFSLLHRSDELKNGLLFENGVEDGGEIRLVPCLESGVNTATAMDPLAMMKHSMSGISDQQIDDFLAGKAPLSVAIRLGESVVVVNLNRAKVEDVEMEPPQEKRHSSHGSGSGSSRSLSRDKHSSGTGLGTASLNTNPHWSSSAACTSTSSLTTPPCSVPVRSVIPAGTPNPSADVGSPSPHLSNAIDDHRHDLLIHGSSSLPTNRRRQREDTDSPSSSPIPSAPLPAHIPPPPSSLSTSLPPSPLIDSPCRTIKKARRSSTSKGGLSKPAKVQLTHTEWEELKRLREAPSSNSGISMKRKAVMEAIGEILKKMYAQRAKGKAPGTFKGRFSSEFTCDNDMQEIIHSRTTMTSYGGGASSRDPDCLSTSRRSRMGHSGMNCGQLTKARYEENETTRSKVELLKWKMQQQRALKKQKRDRTDHPSPCGWMEAIDVDLQAPPPKIRKKTGFGGFKRGFLLSD